MAEKRGFSWRPDPHMRWIYDSTHPDYNSPRAKNLRAARDHALASMPGWMREMANENDKDSGNGERAP